MQRYHNLSIGRRLFFSYSALIVLTIVIVFITVLTGRLETAAYEKLQAAQGDAVLAAQLGREMDQARDHQQDFLLVSMSGWASPNAPYEQSVANLQAAKILLESLANGQPESSPSAQIQQINAEVTGYEASFNQLVTVIIPTRGHGEMGVSLELKTAVTELRTAIEALPQDPTLHYAALNIEQSADTYIHIPSEGAALQFSEATVTIGAAINAAPYDAATKAILRALLDKTVTQFSAVIAQDMLVFQEYNSLRDHRAALYGLIGAFIEDKREEQTRALSRLETVQRQGLLAQLAMGGLLIGVGALMAYHIAQSISHRVNSLTGKAQQIAQGCFGERLDAEMGDEIGQLARSFNAMAAAIEQREVELRTKAEHLQVAMQQAQEANRLKDEFLAVMSHELRTPLNAIIGFHALIDLTADLDSENRQRLQRLRVNAERLLYLISDVLDISRIEAGRFLIAPSPTNVRALVNNLKSHLDILADDKNLAFCVDVDRSLPSVLVVDPDALARIITNLLSNAFKFTTTGSVVLRLRADASVWHIEVQDTGVGIPEMMQGVIFERFRQADSSTTRHYGGTGLGLTIVQRLCQAMNATIRVQSEVNHGSTFTVTLPLWAAEGVPVQKLEEFFI